MKTIGNYLRESRLSQNFDVVSLSEETRIRVEFIEALEGNDWDSLPEYPVVVGFVKNIASVLELDPLQATALLRRDYPPKKRVVSAKPAQPKKSPRSPFVPKLRFALLILGLVALVLIYLLRQYQVFSSPPMLTVTAPIEEQVVSTRSFTVRGKTASDAVVKVNNQPAVVEDDGNFKTDIEINENVTEVIIRATSRAGKETTIQRRIRVRLEEGN